MKHLMGLGFAGFLGVVAAALNWIWLAGLATPDDFVSIDDSVEIGEELSEELLAPVPIPGDAEELQKSFIPWSDRAVLFGSKASRTYVAGDIVMHRDIQPPTDDSQWNVIGPFKLISVGERFKERDADDDLEAARTDGNTLTIAVDANFDASTRQLLQVIRPDRNLQDTDAPPIVAVQVLPSNSQQLGTIQKEPANVVYQTVSLEGIANVPRVLLEGDMIRFVVPGRPQY